MTFVGGCLDGKKRLVPAQFGVHFKVPYIEGYYSGVVQWDTYAVQRIQGEKETHWFMLSDKLTVDEGLARLLRRYRK